MSGSSRRRPAEAFLRLDRVARLHPGHEVRTDMAVEEPGARIVGHHVGDDHSHRQEARDIRAHVLRVNGVAVPVRRVDFEVRRGHQVPAHAFAHSDVQHRQVAVEVPVQIANAASSRLSSKWCMLTSFRASSPSELEPCGDLHLARSGPLSRLTERRAGHLLDGQSHALVHDVEDVEIDSRGYSPS